MANSSKQYNIAVIGAGVFGCTVAAKLSEELGAEVHVIDALPDILQAASNVNQNRLHRGYHYPRSPETIRLTRDALCSFRHEFEPAVIDGGTHLYAIAKENSFLTALDHERVWGNEGLSYYCADSHVSRRIVNPDMLSAVYAVNEPRLDVDRLRYLLRARLENAEVTLDLGRDARTIDPNNWDYIINCTYAGYSQVSEHFGGKRSLWQYELCEKPVVQLPRGYEDTSIVVMDGPFMCIDPWGTTGLSLLGNVKYAIHQVHITSRPPTTMFDPILNKGLIQPRHIGKLSRFPIMQEHGGKYLPILKEAKHIGSLFTWRVVPPNRDTDDARPTLVKKHGKLINVFSGKIPTAVWAAERVIEVMV